MAAVLAASLPPRERILSIRVARRVSDPSGGSATESATTDQVLAGLERAVDPGGDGDPSDAVPVALLGVSSPYAGFDDSPEAQAVRAASALGTLVVAPAGNDGAGAGEFGTVGSPAAARGALAVGALDGAGPGVPGVKIGIAARGGRALAHGALLGGRVRACPRSRCRARRRRTRRAASPRPGARRSTTSRWTHDPRLVGGSSSSRSTLAAKVRRRSPTARPPRPIPGLRRSSSASRTPAIRSLRSPRAPARGSRLSG